MTRVRISLGVLLLLVVTSAFTSLWVNWRCGEMIDDINKLGIIAENGYSEECAGLAEELNERWENFRSRASVLVKYDKLVEIDRLCSRIVRLSEEGNGEFTAELAELRDMLEMLKSGEIPQLTSVF
ncbi:DUF4363 family protein [Ruminococcus sp.]|uniref:DUF4363 family protein n=1 Tax=Ruminococcus sp. TaxID=41978 RepID=UPI001B474B7E|nr:DUF4363 family protein [Ruminococcus sp.]MBP5431901.1 DUF4363 family protein [Ruminococcus sp.]